MTRLQKIVKQEPERFGAMCRKVLPDNQRRYLQLFGCPHDWLPGVRVGVSRMFLCRCRICGSKWTRLAAMLCEDEIGE